jgi:hypothetical protein
MNKVTDLDEEQYDIPRAQRAAVWCKAVVGDVRTHLGVAH